MLRMHSDVMSRQSHTPNTKSKIRLFMFPSFLSEIDFLAAAVLQINILLFLFGCLVRKMWRACACMNIRFFSQVFEVPFAFVLVRTK